MTQSGAQLIATKAELPAVPSKAPLALVFHVPVPVPVPVPDLVLETRQ